MIVHDCLNGMVLVVTNRSLKSLKDPGKEEAFAGTDFGGNGEDSVFAARKVGKRSIEPFASEFGTGRKSLKLTILGKKPLPDVFNRSYFVGTCMTQPLSSG